jgi:uncharacterized membrane protein YhiD involved in acid resistance
MPQAGNIATDAASAAGAGIGATIAFSSNPVGWIVGAVTLAGLLIGRGVGNKNEREAYDSAFDQMAAADKKKHEQRMTDLQKKADTENKYNKSILEEAESKNRLDRKVTTEKAKSTKSEYTGFLGGQVNDTDPSKLFGREQANVERWGL